MHKKLGGEYYDHLDKDDIKKKISFLKKEKAP